MAPKYATQQNSIYSTKKTAICLNTVNLDFTGTADSPLIKAINSEPQKIYQKLVQKYSTNGVSKLQLKQDSDTYRFFRYIINHKQRNLLPFKKPNSKNFYLNIQSNHLQQILKPLHITNSKRLNKLQTTNIPLILTKKLLNQPNRTLAQKTQKIKNIYFNPPFFTHSNHEN